MTFQRALITLFVFGVAVVAAAPGFAAGKTRRKPM